MKVKLKLGDYSDKLYGKDEEIRKLEKTLRKLKSERNEIESEFLQAFNRNKIDGCRGARSTASIKIAQYPTIKNRAKFEHYVLRHRAFDLFQSRITSKAYFARLEEGEKIPGTDVFERTRVSVRKRGAS